MAKYRYVHCEFWEDPDMLDYTPEEKFFYLYVLTNPHTKQCGIYEISIKQMAFETGFNRDTIKNLLERFNKKYEKIKYNFDTKEIVIKNWGKYNLQNTGKPIVDCVKEELKSIKDKTLIKYIINSITKNKLKGLYINKLDGAYTEGDTAGTQKEKEKENKKEKYIRKHANEIKEIFNCWKDLLSDVNNARLTKKTKKIIATKLRKWNKEKIIQGIKNYNEIYRSDYYYSHNWTLQKFIKQGNGICRFKGGLDQKYDGDIYKDYKENIKKKTSSGLKKIR